jgi:hypothetical protein
MAFYGGGLMMFIVALVLSHFTLSFSKIAGLTVKVTAVIVLLFFLIKSISPRTLEYNTEIISRFWKQEKDKMPRKLIAHSYYLQSYPKNIMDFLFGSGPGTYNSRSAFVISSPDYFREANAIKSEKMPSYFRNYAYSLWNARNTIQYQDGFMNQPFSSVLAFLGEYGFIFTVAFIVLAYRQHLFVLSLNATGHDDALKKHVYRFVSIFFFLLLFIDNYAEYPEITITLILVLKLLEGSLLLNTKQSIEA